MGETKILAIIQFFQVKWIPIKINDFLFAHHLIAYTTTSFHVASRKFEGTFTKGRSSIGFKFKRLKKLFLINLDF